MSTAAHYVETTPDGAARFRRWQWRTLLGSMVGYAAFYLIRKNLSVAMPAMQQALGLTRTDLGLFLTLHGLLYGVSKFVNGVWGDRANARAFLLTGLVLSLAANVAFGLSSSVAWLGFFWVLNGWVQGMGFPPCARLLTHWFCPEQLPTRMAFWNTAHSLGTAATLVVCGQVVGAGWRWCFFVPAAMVAVLAVGLAWALRDTPRSVGLPELPLNRRPASEGERTFGAFVRREVFGNRVVWLFALANFFVYTIRYGLLDWGPTLLTEWKGVSLQQGVWMIAGFELAGVAGMLTAGWCTERFFGGRPGRTCVVCMIGVGVVLTVFWLVDRPSPWLATGLLGAGGFFIYGPQALVGIAVANLATNRAAATAVGFTGLFGYLSTVVSGVALGRMVDAHGWAFAFGGLVIAAVVGIGLFALTWRAVPHGYTSLADEVAEPGDAARGVLQP